MSHCFCERAVDPNSVIQPLPTPTPSPIPDSDRGFMVQHILRQHLVNLPFADFQNGAFVLTHDGIYIFNRHK